MQPSRDIARLLEIMATLRTPKSGCPWDLDQSFETIAPYTIEEAYEVADAIARSDLDGLREELGDLLLQVVFHAQMAEEERAFDFGDVVQAITAKLIRRHPHVFGGDRELTPTQVKGLWESIKAEERAEKKVGDVPKRTLDGVPLALPALTRALKLQQKASCVGFDWNDVKAVFAKIDEEVAELRDAMSKRDAASISDEIGDLMFALVNLARHHSIDPEAALRGTNAKFERRFASIEDALAIAGRTPADSTLNEMDRLWNAAKDSERRG